MLTLYAKIFVLIVSIWVNQVAPSASVVFLLVSLQQQKNKTNRIKIRGWGFGCTKLPHILRLIIFQFAHTNIKMGPFVFRRLMPRKLAMFCFNLIFDAIC